MHLNKGQVFMLGKKIIFAHKIEMLVLFASLFKFVDLLFKALLWLSFDFNGTQKCAQNVAFHEKLDEEERYIESSEAFLFSFPFRVWGSKWAEQQPLHILRPFGGKKKKGRRGFSLSLFSVQWSFSWLCCSSSLLPPASTIHNSASGLIDALRQNWREIKVLFRVWNEQNREPNSRKSSLSENPKHYYCLLPCQGTFSQSPFNRVRLDRLEVVTTAVPRGFPIFLFSFVQKILHILQFSLISKDRKNAARSNPF